MMGRDRVERLADVIVGGNAPDLEERAGVVAAASLFHGLLVTQERRALGEKDGESRQSDVAHVELSIGACAPVGQLGGDTAEAFDEEIEGARVHAPRDAGTGSKVQVTNG